MDLVLTFLRIKFILFLSIISFLYSFKDRTFLTWLALIFNKLSNLLSITSSFFLKINNFFLNVYLNDKKTEKYLYYWLITMFVLVSSIIIVGGLTRLTDSGLSITEWELFKGLLPPLSSYEWKYYFDLYKKNNFSEEIWKNYLLQL